MRPLPWKWVIKLQPPPAPERLMVSEEEILARVGGRTGTAEGQCRPRGRIRGNGPERQPEVQAGIQAAPPAVQIMKQRGDQKPGDSLYLRGLFFFFLILT